MFVNCPSPLKIMFLIDLLDKIGGAERNLSILARGLRDRGHEVIIVPIQGGETTNKLRREGFQVRELNLKRVYDLKGICSLIKIIQFARKEKLSSIVSYHESSDFIGLIISLLLRIPIISSRRDMGFKLKPRHVWAYRILNRFFTHITTVSSAVKEKIVTSQWINVSKVTVIENGVFLLTDSDGQSEKGRSIVNEDAGDDGSINICCLANFRPVKGHVCLIDAVKEIIKQFPEVHLFFVGQEDRESDYYKLLLRKIEMYGLEKFIKFTGELPPNQVPSMLEQMDISVLSSTSEGMSNTILESMAASKPIVATSVGGNPELVVDGETGFLVPPNNSILLAQALLKLIKNPGLCREMGTNGRSRVESLFNLDRMIDRHEDLIQYVYLRKNLSPWIKIKTKIKSLSHVLITSGKVMISSVLYYSGIITLFRFGKQALRLGRVNILCFHDISEGSENRFQLSISLSNLLFYKLIDFIKESYSVISLEKAVNLMESGQSLRDDVFVITFDDCYRGWVKYVMPECKKNNIPYTVFLSTGPLDTRKPLLYNALVFLSEKTWRKVINLSPWGLGCFLVETTKDANEFIETIHEHWLGRNLVDQDILLKELSEYLGVELSRKAIQETLIDWNQVRLLVKSGANVGAHTVNHPCLADLTSIQSKMDIINSKKRIEESIGHSIDIFAYPFGAQDHYNQETTKIVEDAGFRYAFTLGTKNGKRFKPFEIARRGVSHGMFEGIKADFSKALFATELCGLADYVFGRKIFKTKLDIYKNR
ncbi:glycosyltransferase [Thermodesulfobacteriota bacterium]